MKVDNPTDYPFANSLRSDYGFEVMWNATGGRNELLRVEYVNRLGGNVESFRSKRITDVLYHSISLLPFLNTKFTIKWVWRDTFYCLIWDGKTIVIRNTDISEFV